MPSTNVIPFDGRQRNRRDFSLCRIEEARRDAILAAAYLRIVEAFDCRPDPRAAWDRCADGTETRWTRLLAPIRMAVAAAVVMGDQEKIDATVEAARAFFRELEADIASLVPRKDEESTVTLALAETHVEGAANEAEMALVEKPECPITAERAVLPLERHSQKLERLLTRVRTIARRPRSPSMVSIR